MKKIFLAAAILFSATTFASNLRDQCENAYYANAGGVTELHQYRVIVKWGVLSDSLLKQVEDIVYAEQAPLKMLSEKYVDQSALTGKKINTSFYVMKEQAGYDYRDYVIALEELEELPGISVSCK